MRERKRRKLPKKLAAIGLAATLCLNLTPAWAVEGGEDPSGGDSSSEFVGSFDLQQIFGPGALELTDNHMLLASTTGGYPWQTAHWNSGLWINQSALSSKNKISLQADWEIETSYTLQPDNATNCVGRYGVTGTAGGDWLAFDAGLLGSSYKIYAARFTGSNCTEYLSTKELSSSSLTGAKVQKLRYDASAQTFYISFDGVEVSYKNQIVKTATASLSVFGQIAFSKSARVPNATINADFLQARYTHYTPQFVSTELLDKDGNTMTDEEKKALKDGDVVTVRATVKNTHPDAGKEIVYDHLTLVPGDDEKVKKYPTAGLDILTGADQTVTVDGKAVTNASGQPYDVSGEGIPFGCTAAGNVITYKAKINNPDGKSVTVGQRMSDDFFDSKQYSSAELIPAQPLVPADPEKPEGEAGKDYHYTRTSPNENGWNNSDVAITFYPGDFNQFYIKDPEEGTVHATLTSEKEPLLYTDETETPVALQAENSKSGAKSVRNDDVIKVDKVPPTLTAASPAPALFGFRRAAAPASSVTLADNLSGIWKLERYDTASKEWVAAETFDLPTEGAEKGNGKASESASIGQNGLYRAVDAAGNVGEPTPVSFNAPPSVTPADPEAPELEPEEETDEGGLRHAAASDSMSEYIDKAAPLYGGRFTLEDAAELMAQRYGFASNVERDDSLNYTYAITQKGADVSGQGVDTTQAGSFVVVCTATDADGNTTTLYLTDTLIDPDAPPLVERQEEGTPPVGPPFDPLKPVPQPVIKEDPETGRYHAYVYEQIAEGVREPGAYGGSLTGATAQQIFAGRYGFVSQQGDGELSLSPICVTQDGKDVSAAGYDTAKPGSCVISQTATDSRGNKTTVYLTYTFLPVGSPPWVAYDPSDPTVEPGSELEEPEIVEDWQSGTKYATVTDRLVQTITDPPLSDGWLDGEELRAFLQSRYQFTSAQPDGMLKEVRFAVSRDGKAVEGIDTTQPGEYLIAYTLEDSAENRTSLFLQYQLKPGAAGDLAPDGNSSGGATPYTGMDGGSGHGADGHCPIHWLALLGALCTLLYWLGRKTFLGRGRHGLTLWDAVLLALAGGCAVSLAFLARCGLDVPALLCWGGVIFMALWNLSAEKKEEEREGEAL
ncbi:hypothetical protein SAMN05444424_0787 [Bittarella massiliensis (ex Durand et al. 2017)]|uniref:DUF11 domain-containing protein n=1 Tax=Bittarella massiliensis (ex Durand et al. 2017) TaxID=1720313 RepID=A0AAQ1MCD5_9FIRM|nr:hypothetical protein HMPREF0262_02361 [Clostridium sp. ATCC 29733]SHF81726.1 hypothetical protein SAMN05444424_0787 [Bittarella massiliensis (ex Durand et al. 2017)]